MESPVVDGKISRASVDKRSFPPATALSKQLPSPVCHPDWSEAEGRDLQFALPATNLSWRCLPFPCHPDRSEAKRRDLRFALPVTNLSWKCLPPSCHPRACDFLALPGPCVSDQANCKPPNKTVILSEALRRSMANSRLYGAQSKDPGDAALADALASFPATNCKRR